MAGPERTYSKLSQRLFRLNAIISVHPRHLLASAFELFSFRQHSEDVALAF